MKDIDRLLLDSRKNNASDVHLTYGLPPVYRVYGSMEKDISVLRDIDSQALIKSMLDDRMLSELAKNSDVDMCYTIGENLRHRVNVYTQQGRLCATIRNLNDQIPDIDEMGLPAVFKTFADLPRGLVLVTGATGSGKSTTLAAMLNYINENQKSHIITIEDPVEYVHRHKKSLIHQREVGSDTASFASALRSALREDPDTILVGEMRDLETISAAITAAETGHLVLSTLHTSGAASTIDRIVDVFPADAQAQIRTQLAAALRGVISQQLLKKADGTGRVPAFEILVANDAISNLIREAKGYQINSMLQAGQKDGMQLLDAHLARLTRDGVITQEAALEACADKSVYLDLL